MGDYILLHLADGGIYGAAAPDSLEELQRLMDFAHERGISFTTGKLHSVQELIQWATVDAYAFRKAEG